MSSVNWDDSKYQDEAKGFIRANQVLTHQGKNAQQIRTRILSAFLTLTSLTNALVKERQITQARSTCLGLSDKLIVVGTSDATMHVFNRDNENFLSTFVEKSKEFAGNAVTAIDIHPLRPQYAVLGFQKGHAVLVDLSQQPPKSLKTIKDTTKAETPIINIKFCDWIAGGV